ncbi:hypothetical protein PCASD_14314 [Puccinia coronata f. sp. avenae]|uniref:Uncharacterized protein n=1 Tax=Puccinia coronata f. sp. avenae TaxID=200324 RepID=A0A2N5U9R5_9BASI|nr:hypothetical protein PCASD_14314 [Puccinia coronata f. sp. avenae]
MDTRAGGNASQPPIKHSLRFDEHMRCFEFVLENLDQCRQDDSLITSRLLSPASAHLSTILELLWEIQRKESLVQLLARGLDRHQSKTISTSSTSLPLSEKPNSTRNDTELERRIQVGKLSIMWMRLHCLQSLFTDLEANGDQQSPRWISSQRVLNRYFSLSPTSAHRTTSNPYLSRLMGSPTCAAAYIEAAHGFIKIWKALPAHLMQQSQTQSAPANKNLPILMTQLNDLAKSLNIPDTYSEPLDLIKPCAHALICQTLDWTLNAHHKAVSVTKKASLFQSRTSYPSANNHKSEEALRTESKSQVASTVEPRLSPPNTKTPPRQVASPQRLITDVKTPVLLSSQCAPPEPSEAPPTKSKKQVAPTTQPKRLLNPSTPSRQAVSPRPLATNTKTPIHPISQSAPSESHEVGPTESEKRVAPTSEPKRRVIEPPLNSKTPPRQIPSPQPSKTNAATSIHLTSRSVPPEPQEATPTSSKNQVAPKTEPQRHLTEPPLHCKTSPRQVRPAQPSKTNVAKSIHLIPPSGPSGTQKTTPTQSGKEMATPSEPKQHYTEPPLSSKTPPRQVSSPRLSQPNAATSNHSTPQPQKAPAIQSGKQVASTVEPAQPVPVPPPNFKLPPREVAPLEVAKKNAKTSIRFISYSTVTREPSDAPSTQLGPQTAPPTESEKQHAVPVQIPKAAFHVPQSPGDRSLPSSPPKRNTADKLVSSIPALACSSTPDAGQLSGHVKDQESSQTDIPPNHELTPPSQTLDGSLASSNTILSVCGIEGRVDINNSVTVRVSSAPALEELPTPAVKVSSSPAAKVSPAPEEEESTSPDKRTTQPTSEISQACCSREGSKIQPAPLPTQIPSRDQTVGSNDVNRAGNLSPNKAQLNLNNLSFNKMRHSVGPRMEGSSSSVTGRKEMMSSSNKRKRRCTESGGHERRKRLQLETIMESPHTQNLLKEFKDNPRLSKAFQQATDLAIQNESRVYHDHIPPDSEHSQSPSDSEHGSLLDDTSAELDPALIEKLKANAAQFKDKEDSEFAKILSLADRDLRKRSAC